jgi:tetratricopeptide (TPR) repeat protein
MLSQAPDASEPTAAVSTSNTPREAKKMHERGLRAFRSGRLAEAQSAVASAVAIYPAYAAAWVDLGRIHFKRGDLDPARDAFEKAFTTGARCAGAALGLALIAVHDHDWEQASFWTTRAIALDPAGPLAHYLEALASLETGRLDAAEVSARAARKRDPGRRIAEIDQLLGVVCALRGDYSRAIQHFREYAHHATDRGRADAAREQLRELEKRAARLPM